MLKNAHIVIKQYRLIYILMLAFVCLMTWDMWNWYKINAESLEMASSGAFGAAFLAMIAIVKFGLEGLRQDSEHD